ncbi:MAG: RNA polymerase sigma factor [Xanthomonadales bacterium]|nr:RNA polymerase sigma factor [Gammaproteobacteria bacterium]NNK03576.1 RNA polymerase sigma factor [Xanthomonadales bacterium]NNL00277.1 RNA polymerase sigma factor [Xanthomonadales bacterium]
MHKAQDYYPECPEVFLISLARTGDRKAFAEIVRRKQSSIRNLMRRCCNDYTLADDLTQQVFLKVWLGIRKLRKAAAFNGWLKRVAVSVWLQHIRKKDALGGAGEMTGNEQPQHDTTGMVLDLDRALVKLPNNVRLCVVLSYHEGTSHSEIAELTGMPLGTVKSHIRNGAHKLQELLSAYGDPAEVENA